MRIDGSCHCGRLTYEADIDPDKVGVCHCTDCQTLSGSAFTAFVPLAKGAFCPDCGTRLYASAEKEPQLWCRSALPWVMQLGAVKQHPKQAA